MSNSELTVLLDRRKIAEKIEVLTNEATDSSTNAIELRIPVNLRRVGQEKRLIVAAHTSETNPDPVLITAVVKAHRWFEMLKSREVQTMGALARAEKVQRTYITSLLPLALLAPDITEAILEGANRSICHCSASDQSCHCWSNGQSSAALSASRSKKTG